jgi:hypothetical protein
MNFGATRERVMASVPLPKNGNGNGEGAANQALQDIYIVIKPQQPAGRAMLKTITFQPE